MNDNLPVNMEGQENGGTINYANEVIAIIAGMAMSEVDGVAGKRPAAKSVTERIGLTKAVNPVTKGVRVEVGSEEAAVDLTLAVEYGKPIQKVCTEVQENVRKAIETMTGLHVVKVDVHVTSVIFEKDEQAAEAALIVGKTAERPLRARRSRTPPRRLPKILTLKTIWTSIPKSPITAKKRNLKRRTRRRKTSRANRKARPLILETKKRSKCL